VSEGSHHVGIYNLAGVRVGHLRITNSGNVIHVHLNDEAVSNPGLFFPEVKE